MVYSSREFYEVLGGLTLRVLAVEPGECCNSVSLVCEHDCVSMDITTADPEGDIIPIIRIAKLKPGATIPDGFTYRGFVNGYSYYVLMIIGPKNEPAR